MSDSTNPSASESEAKTITISEEKYLSMRKELAEMKMALSNSGGTSQQQVTSVHNVASERESAAHRQVIFGNSRQSILLHSSPSLSSPPHTVPAAPFNPRRLTIAEQLSSSPFTTPRRPLRESEAESEETEGEKWEVNEKGWKDL